MIAQTLLRSTALSMFYIACCAFVLMKHTETDKTRLIMEELFKTPTQEEIDRQWLTQLCYDGDMADDEIEEFVDAVIQWKNKAVQCALSNVVNRRELLLAYSEWWDKKYSPSRLDFHRQKDVDRFLSQ